MATLCSQCGTKLQGSHCWKCGAEAPSAIAPIHRDSGWRGPQIDLRLERPNSAIVVAGSVSTAAGIALFVLPLIGLLVAACTLVALIVIFRSPSDNEPPTV